DLGGMLWGNRGGFQYRAALLDGSDQDAPQSSLRGATRVSYNWFTHETKFGDSGTYLGEERLLQIAADVDFQNDRTDPDDLMFPTLLRDYHAWAAEMFYEEPFRGKWHHTVEGAYLEREDDNINPGTDTRTIEGYYGQIGFLLPGNVGPGRLQLTVRYEEYDRERGSSLEIQKNVSYGLNFYGRAHNGKIQFQYTNRDEEPIEIDNDEVVLSVIATF
ncbi:MAG: porin, partial [Acidobacteria bacterium]|nr:porin [Acidobacteriota bacterium]